MVLELSENLKLKWNFFNTTCCVVLLDYFLLYSSLIAVSNFLLLLDGFVINFFFPFFSHQNGSRVGFSDFAGIMPFFLPFVKDISVSTHRVSRVCVVCIIYLAYVCQLYVYNTRLTRWWWYYVQTKEWFITVATFFTFSHSHTARLPLYKQKFNTRFVNHKRAFIWSEYKLFSLFGILIAH